MEAAESILDLVGLAVDSLQSLDNLEKRLGSLGQL